MKKKPIDEILKIARDMLWNPQIDAKRMPMIEMAEPIGSAPKGRKRTLPQIMAVDAEMRAVWGNCPATEMFFRKMLQESGFEKPPRKLTEEEWDELLGE